MKKSDLIIIFLFLILALTIRICSVLYGDISFHYDMSRDAYAAEEIWRYHQLKILGPPTSTPGLYHGVAYYYLLALFYWLGQGDPRVAASMMAFLNSLTVIPIFLLAKNFYKSLKWGIIGAILFTVSFEVIQYAGWMSNPAPAILTVTGYFLGLFYWQQKKISGFYLSLISAVLSIHFQFFLVYLLVGIVIYKYLFSIKISIKHLIYGSVILLLGLSSFIISMFKFDSFGQVLTGLLSFSESNHFFFDNGFVSELISYINHFTSLYINNFLPSNVFLGGLLGLVCLYICRREKFIMFGLLLNGLIFIFGGHSSNYANIGIVTPAILSVIYLFKKLNRNLFVLLLVLIILSNIYTLIKLAPFGQVELVIPKAMKLKSQLNLIDKTYEIAKNNDFSINSITLPLWTNTTWAYLYHWYGDKKYGFTPKFHGRDQVGLPGNNSLEKIDKPLTNSFLILEPGDGIPTSFYNDEINYENFRTNLHEKFNFNDLILHYRQPIN